MKQNSASNHVVVECKRNVFIEEVRTIHAVAPDGNINNNRNHTTYFCRYFRIFPNVLNSKRSCFRKLINSTPVTFWSLLTRCRRRPERQTVGNDRWSNWRYASEQIEVDLSKRLCNRLLDISHYLIRLYVPASPLPLPLQGIYVGHFRQLVR